jgi:chaperonin GroEL (HSP60 family)
MAQPNDGSGRAPVAIVRPTTSVTSGPAVTQKLVGAAVAFGNLISGTFGPNGLDKMLYKTSGEAAVTNDGAKIVSELLVKHPAAKAFVLLAESQENAFGDGVTGCLIFASELMREAGRLLEKGLHPLILVNGYRNALQYTLQHLEKVEKQINFDDTERLISVAKTSLAGTSAETNSDELARIIVSASKQVTTVKDGDYIVNSEDIRMAKSGMGSISDTRFIRGIVLERRLKFDTLPRDLSAGKVAVLSCPVELQQTTRDSEVEITTPDQWEAFIDAEQEILDSKTEKILSSGASILFCAESVDDRIMHRLVGEGLFVLDGLERSGVEDLALSTGADMINHIDDLGEENLGNFQSMSIIRVEDTHEPRDRITLDIGEHSKLSTIDVGGGSGVASEEIIRGMYDALRSVCASIECGSVICGGGNLHMSASLFVREKAELNDGRERLAMEGFARALEAIPATLASNAGQHRLDALLALRALHRSNALDGGINRNGAAGTLQDVLECSDTIAHAIEAACETACGLLRVDQVISARGD